MRVVLDTNTVVSGFLWGNEPRAIIDAVIDGRIKLFTCAALIEELAGVLPPQNNSYSARQNFSRAWNL